MFGQVDVLRLPSVHFMVFEPVDVCAEDSSEIARRKYRRGNRVSNRTGCATLRGYSLVCDWSGTR